MTIPASTTQADHPWLTARGLRKSFGGGEVLHGVDFEVRAGEVHALCGENGAGKTTLMNILAGILKPDAGWLRFAGDEFKGFLNASEAQRRGVAMVFQERSLFGPLTVAENIYAARQPTWAGFIRRKDLRARSDALLKEIAPDIQPGDILENLSPAQQQMVEIAKALSLDAKVIIFDEPTAALTETETARLFAVIAKLRQRGAGIAYISHRLEEIFRVSDRVTVLKDGVWQGTRETRSTTTAELIRLMVGRNIEPRRETVTAPDAPVLLEVRHWNDPPARHGFRPLLRDINFFARSGEVVGFAGLAGAGRTQLALSLFGARPRGTGTCRLEGRVLTLGSPAEAMRSGLAYVSEDRKETGLFLEMSLARNIASAEVATSRSLFLSAPRERRLANDFREGLQITSRNAEQEVSRLSGGNQQKVFIARWLLVNPRVLIVDEPTRGVDVGAKAAIHQLLYDHARRGNAVMVLSSDLPEILTISDRIYVMRAGCIAGELSRREATEEAVMRLAASDETGCQPYARAKDREGAP